MSRAKGCCRSHGVLLGVLRIWQSPYVRHGPRLSMAACISVRPPHSSYAWGYVSFNHAVPPSCVRLARVLLGDCAKDAMYKSMGGGGGVCIYCMRHSYSADRADDPCVWLLAYVRPTQGGCDQNRSGFDAIGSEFDQCRGGSDQPRGRDRPSSVWFRPNLERASTPRGPNLGWSRCTFDEMRGKVVTF